MSRSSTAYENAAVTGGASVTLYESLHTADPGTTGASEVSGGSYARQSVSWASASGGSIANSNTLTTSVPASTTIAFFGLYNALTVGTYGIGGPLSATVTFVTAGTFTIAPGGLSIGAS